MKTQKLNLGSETGLTLVEVLVALAIMTGLLLSVFVIVDSSFTSSNDVIEEDEENMAVETAMERIRVDFAQIYTPLYFSSYETEDKENRDNNYQGTNTFPKLTKSGGLVPKIAQETAQEFVFFIAGNRRKVAGQKQSQYAWIRYSIRDYKPDIEENEMTNSQKPRSDAPYELVRQIVADNPYREEINWEEVKKNVMMRHISEFKLTFWDDRRRKFVESLRSVTRNKLLLRAIKIEMSYMDPTLEIVKTERIFTTNWPRYDIDTEEKEIQKKIKAAIKKEGEESGIIGAEN